MNKQIIYAFGVAVVSPIFVSVSYADDEAVIDAFIGPISIDLSTFQPDDQIEIKDVIKESLRDLTTGNRENLYRANVSIGYVSGSTEYTNSFLDWYSLADEGVTPAGQSTLRHATDSHEWKVTYQLEQLRPERAMVAEGSFPIYNSVTGGVIMYDRMSGVEGYIHDYLQLAVKSDLGIDVSEEVAELVEEMNDVKTDYAFGALAESMNFIIDASATTVDVVTAVGAGMGEVAVAAAENPEITMAVADAATEAYYGGSSSSSSSSYGSSTSASDQMFAETSAETARLLAQADAEVAAHEAEQAQRVADYNARVAAQNSANSNRAYSGSTTSNSRSASSSTRRQVVAVDVDRPRQDHGNVTQWADGTRTSSDSSYASNSGGSESSASGSSSVNSGSASSRGTASDRNSWGEEDNNVRADTSLGEPWAIVWEHHPGHFWASGPTQRTSISDDTEAQALDLVWQDWNGSMVQQPSIGRCKVYKGTGELTVSQRPKSRIDQDIQRYCYTPKPS